MFIVLFLSVLVCVSFFVLCFACVLLGCSVCACSFWGVFFFVFVVVCCCLCVLVFVIVCVLVCVLCCAIFFVCSTF